ncbi:MAG: efflux transporter outer membrane subunit [Chromatiales bacterium]|nr:MAG: efflux transporter outer membrane subunit [Chromatiales bacterium]
MRRRGATSVTAIAFSVLTGGCVTVGPDFETPEADVAEAWQQAQDQRISAGQGDYSEWWASFNDPALQSLVQQAFDQNKTLQIAGLRVFEARAIVGVAVGNLYPQLQRASGSAGRIKISENADLISGLPGPVRNDIDTTFQDYRVGFDAAWELDFWGRFRRNVEFADANLAASIATYDDVLVTLAGEVAAAYIILRTLEERLGVAEANVAIQQRSLEISEVRNRNQLTTELDPQIARAFLRDTQATIPPLKAGIRQVRNALCVLVGKVPGELDPLLGSAGTIPNAASEAAIGVPAELLRRRPDIRQAELQAAAQSARVGVAVADLYPAFGLTGTIGFAADSTGSVFESDSQRGLGTFGFSWNILNYGRIRSRIRAEDARLQQAITNYQETVLRAAREVEDATADFIAAQEEAAFFEDGTAAALRAVDLSLVQYREGTADFTRVLDAQRLLLAQQDGLTQARGKHARSVVAIYKALGGGWENRSLDNLVPEAMKQEMQDRTKWGNLLDAEAVEPVPAEERGTWRAPD